MSRYLKSYQLVRTIAALLLFSGIYSSCSENFMSEMSISKTTASAQLAATADAAGNYTAAMDPNSTSTQVLRASTGKVAGSAIAMPPGALSIPVSVTIGEGETLASSSVAQQIGLSDNAASAAGPAVSFVPSSSVQASTPFTLSIPISSTTLALNSDTLNYDNMVVIYKWMKVENGVTSYSIGILTRSDLTVGSKSVQFQTMKFGTFQLAVTQTKVTQRIDKPTDEPPILKGDASNPLVGVWSRCEERVVDSYSSTGYTPPTSSSSSSSSSSNGSTYSEPASQTVGSSCKMSADYLSFTLADAPNPGAYGSVQITLSRGGAAVSSKAVSQLTSANFLMDVTGSSVLDHSETVSVEVGQGCYFQSGSGNNIQKRKRINYTRSPDASSLVSGLINSSGQIQVFGSHGLEQNDYVVFTMAPSTSEISTGILYKLTGSTQPFGLSTVWGSPSTVTINPAADGLSVDFKRVAKLVTSGYMYDRGVPSYGTPIVFSELSGVSLTPGSLYYIGSSGRLDSAPGTPISSFGSDGYGVFSEATCSPMDLSQLTLVCDGTDPAATSGTSSSGGTSSGSDTSGSNYSGGTDSLGLRPGAKISEQEYVKFSNNTFIHARSSFEGAKCTGRMLTRIEETGSYTLGAAGAQSSYAISIKMATLKASIMSSDSASYANANPASSGCGLNNWVINTPQDLFKSACGQIEAEHSPPSEVRVEAGALIFKDDTGWDYSTSLKKQ